jgi:hypothetical protein
MGTVMSTMFCVVAAALVLLQHEQVRLRDHLRLAGTQLDLRGTDATDDDLRPLAGDEFRGVTSVLLASTRVGDEGLKHLAKLALIQLDLGRTNVTSTGLEHLARLPIQRLELTGTGVDDRGLAYLRSMPLRMVVLRDTKITGIGLGAFAGDDLKILDLAHTRVGDASLAELQKVKRLQTLILSETAVTDRGLQHIGGILGLRAVDLSGTAVTETAVAGFRRAHPAIEVNTKRPTR